MSGDPKPSRWALGPTALTTADVEALALASFTDGVGCLDAVVQAAAGGPAWTERCRTVLESTLDLRHAMDFDADDDPPSWERAQTDMVHLWVTRGIGEEIAARAPRALGPPAPVMVEPTAVLEPWEPHRMWDRAAGRDGR